MCNFIKLIKIIKSSISGIKNINGHWRWTQQDNIQNLSKGHLISGSQASRFGANLISMSGSEVPESSCYPRLIQVSSICSSTYQKPNQINCHLHNLLGQDKYLAYFPANNFCSFTASLCLHCFKNSYYYHFIYTDLRAGVV